MRYVASTLWFPSILILLCGCGGGNQIGGPGPTASAQSLNIVGNWSFSATSAVSGTLPMTFAGSIDQSGSSVRGTVHVDGSNCYAQLTAVGLTGKLNGNTIFLNSVSVVGQVITFTGHITKNAFSGTYTITGGCAGGDSGTVLGGKIPTLSNSFSGTFATSQGETFDATADLAQGSRPGTEGSYAITGTATFRRSCFSSGTLTPGAFPSGSFIIGKSVALVMNTGNGILSFLGTEDPNKPEISGAYTVSGGNCDQAGTAILVGANPWDY
jgi:hypothetical protein